ncbi:MAG: glycosyltransferase family 4 protein [Pirellulales bacterium]|nr:glycosyltransferase family 4 protein [Pirellulales bacterium]
MRVGLVVEHFDACRGGVEQWTDQFARALVRRGHEVHVVARRFGPRAEGLPIVRHVVKDAPTRVDFAAAAQRTLAPLGLDVVHDMGCGWACDVFQPHGGSRIAAAERKLRLAPAWLRPIKRAVDRLLPRQRQFAALARRQYVDDGRLVVALSRRVADDLMNHYGVPPERLRLVSNGVDTARFSPEHRARWREAIRRRLGVSAETTLLLIVAHNFRLKGVPTLLEAMARWSDPRPAHLVVVGGKRVARYQRLARRLGAADRVTFTGVVADTVPYYAAADAYVHPTHYDPCSLVVLEALASSLPVITSRRNGASELMAEGVEGFLLDEPGDARACLDRIERLLDAPTRRRMGRAARALALRHSFARNVAEMLAVYEEVVARRREAEARLADELARPFVCWRSGAAGTAGRASSGTLAKNVG